MLAKQLEAEVICYPKPPRTAPQRISRKGLARAKNECCSQGYQCGFQKNSQLGR